MEDIEPQIVYEDNHLLVVIKPQNISVQGDSSEDKDLLTFYKDYIKQRDNKPGKVFLGLVHRLDRPTGGVMVFAKTSKAADRLSEQLRDKSMTKVYLCVVVGKPDNPCDRLATYLVKDEKTNTVRLGTKAEAGAKAAELYYEVIRTIDNLSLIRVELFTGRSHQIRVQMSAQNKTPIYCDFKYGDKTHKGNLALWAYEIKFAHPISKKSMTFKIYPPLDVPFDKFKVELSDDKL